MESSTAADTVLGVDAVGQGAEFARQRRHVKYPASRVTPGGMVLSSLNRRERCCCSTGDR
jgi:hypothetical protein